MPADDRDRAAPAARRGDAALVGAFLLSLVVAGASTTIDPDLFHVLANAREALARGALPLRDVFAFTPTRTPVVHHEWLTGLLFYPIVAHAGGAGLLVLTHALHLAAIGLVLLLARRRGASVVTLAFLGPLGIAMALPGLTTLRAHVVTLVFLSALMWCLEADRRGDRRWMLLYVPLHVVWQNCHGGFVVGPLLLVLHAVEQALRGRPARHLVLLVAGLALLLPLNPYGLDYARYLWGALRMDRSVIGEWRLLSDGDPLKVPIWALATLVFVLALLPRGLRAAPGWLLVLVAALMAYRHQRHLSLYAIVWLAHVPPMVEQVRLGEVFRRLWSARPMLTRALLVAALAATLLRDANERRWELRLPAERDADAVTVYPVGVVDYLAARQARGRMVTPFDLGAFVSWKLFPAITVSLDGRYEAAYAPGLTLEHVAFYAGAPSWRAFLAAYPADLVLARRDDGIVALLRAEPAWRLAYEDDAFVLLARADLALAYADLRGRRLAGTFP